MPLCCSLLAKGDRRDSGRKSPPTLGLCVASVGQVVANGSLNASLAEARKYFIAANPRTLAVHVEATAVVDRRWTPLHFLNNVSISLATVLQPAGVEQSVGLISTAYLKDPTDPEWQNDPAIKKRS